MNIDIILPYKEKFSKNEASAVSITVKNSMVHSKFFKNIRVYGQKTLTPFYKKNFIGLNNNWILHGGHNKSLAYHYYKKNLYLNKNKRIIEVHNRPYIFNFLKRKISGCPITLHFHNDPQTMKGSKTVKEREYIAETAAAVYFVSNFIKKKFTEGLKNKYKNLYVIYNGVERKHKKLPNKKKEVLFVGRLVPEKGVHIYCDTIKDIACDYNDWKFFLIGTSKAGQKSPKTIYEKKIIKEFINIGKNTQYLGFMSNERVQKKISQSSILIMPSIWDEPLSLVAIEGICNASLVISSNKGGLPEVIKNSGIILKKNNSESFKSTLLKLFSNEKLLLKYQKNAWKKYKFNSSATTKKHDLIRTRILKKYC